MVFKVVEPSGVHIEQVPGTLVCHKKGIPSAVFIANMYILPDDVFFNGIWVQEAECRAECKDSLKHLTGTVHPRSKKPLAVYAPVSGKGAEVEGNDSIGHVFGGLNPPYSWGEFKWSIPWEFSVGYGGQPKPFATVDHVATIDKDGTLWVSKGGELVHKRLNDPDYP